MKVLAIFAFLFFVAFAAKCLSGDEPAKVKNEACSWYNSNSCCPQEEKVTVSVTGTVSEGPCKIGGGCEAKFNLLVCAPCSPESGNFIKVGSGILNTTFSVCQGFADKFYSACKSSEIDSDGKGTCKKISEIFPDSKAFISGVGLIVGATNVKLVDGTDNCFNAAGFASPILALIVACLVALRLM